MRNSNGISVEVLARTAGVTVVAPWRPRGETAPDGDAIARPGRFVAAAAWIARGIERSHQRLAGCVAESVQVELQSAAIHGRPAEMVMNAAVLVADESRTRFRQIVAALQEEFAACGFSYELTGPWPPYHFASVGQQGIADGAGSDQ